MPCRPAVCAVSVVCARQATGKVVSGLGMLITTQLTQSWSAHYQLAVPLLELRSTPLSVLCSSIILNLNLFDTIL